MSSPTNCLTCRNWARTDDKLVGLCVVHQGYRFQLEDALLTRAEKAEEMVEWLIEAVDGYFFGVEHPASIWRKKISDLVTEWKEREENGK